MEKTKVVYKYPIEDVNNIITLTTPKDALDLFVNFDPKIRKVCLWCLIDKDEKEEVHRSLLIMGTGYDIKGWRIKRHIGSCQAFGTEFYHLFEIEC